LRQRLAAIVGPTAAGKTSVAIRVAQLLNGEIISCDSMQIYRGMDIGTAKASLEEQQQVKHHMLDIVNPDEDYSVARYQEECKTIISRLNQEGKLPILVGGTGLYYQAVVDDYVFEPMESRYAVRDKWNQIIDQRGLDYGYRYLQSVDPEYAQKVSSNDRKRIVRALEVWEITGQPFSRSQVRRQSAYNLAAAGLYLQRSRLYARIDQRAEEMISRGFIEEVEGLLGRGYDPSLNSMQALGYRQAAAYLQGLITREEMIKDMQKETRRYAKRQFTWFNRDQRICWFDQEEYADEMARAEKISRWMEGQFSEA